MSYIKQFPRLFHPGQIGKLEVKNRIVMAPVANMYANMDGTYSQRQIDYYAERAKGGAGLIIVEVTFVERKISPPADPVAPYIDTNWHIPGASDLVDAVHDYGAKICIQLSPGPGRNMNVATHDRIPIAASAVPSFSDPDIICRELSVAEIKEIVRACGDAAERAVKAGFDMIEIHGHLGYLIDGFMTPLYNKRSDEYGGDIEGRMRFAKEIIAAMRSRVGDKFPLCFRYSGEHKIEGGRTLAESQEIARHLESAGIDILDIDAGCYEVPYWITPPYYMPEGCLADIAAGIKKAVKIPVITVGGINSPELAEQILDEEKADFIALGRALIADPQWPNKARNGQIEDIRPCIRCNEGCMGRSFFLRTMACTVNPVVGKEQYYKFNRVEKPKEVMIIGGGPAGMEAARVAALRGHKVTLYEKENELGGQLKAASKPPFKKPFRDLKKYLSGQLNQSGVKIETGKEVTAHLVEHMKPEAVIIATGASPVTPSFPHQTGNIITVEDFLTGKKEAGDTVIILGASLVGCDTALYCAREKKKVTVIQMRADTGIAQDVNFFSREKLLQELARYGVTILTDLAIKEVTSDGVLVTDGTGKQQTLVADTIIAALGGKAQNELAMELKDKVRELYLVGDCVSPRKILEAIREGFLAGWQL